MEKESNTGWQFKLEFPYEFTQFYQQRKIMKVKEWVLYNKKIKAFEPKAGLSVGFLEASSQVTKGLYFYLEQTYTDGEVKTELKSKVVDLIPGPSGAKNV